MAKIPEAYSNAGISKPTTTVKAELEIIADQFKDDPKDDSANIVERADEAVSNDTSTANITNQEEMSSKIDISWLPFAAKTYKISPHLNDYGIVNFPICPSDIPKRNGVSFPLSVLTW